MARKKNLSPGDDVTWSSHGQKVEGTVKKKIDKRTKAAGRTVDASEEDPQYKVESARTGGTAVHKPEALRKKGSSS